MNVSNKCLINILCYLIFCSISALAQAEVSLGVLLGNSKPKNYGFCPCAPDSSLIAVKAKTDVNVLSFFAAYQFSNGFLTELRLIKGSNRSNSQLSSQDGTLNMQGVDIELDHLSSISIGYRFWQEKDFSPYLLVGNTFNVVVSAFDEKDGTFLEKQNFSNNLNFGAGLDWKLFEKIAIRADFYQYNSAGYGDSDKVDIHALSVGLKYSF